MKGLHRKLLLTLLPVVILPLLALGLQSMMKLGDMANRNMELRLTSLATTINEHLNGELRRNTVELAQLPNAEALISYLATKVTGTQKVYMGTRVQRMFHQLLVGNKGFLQLSLLNSDNKELLRVGEGINPFHDIAPSNLIFMQYWAAQAAASDQFNYLMYSPEMDEYVYKQGLRFIRSGPEISRDGEPVQRYSLILTYSLRKFGEMFLKQQVQQGIYLLLLDKSNTFIAGEAPLGWRSGGPETDEISLPGGDYLVRRLPLADGLILQALIPQKLMTAEATELRITTAIWLIISSLILLALLHVVLKRLILNPVSDLRNLMKQVATHEISEISLVLAEDEMAELHNHFSGMLSQLEVSKRELERAAFIDPLTGIGNRSAFIRYLQNMVERHNEQPFHFYLVQLKLHNLTWINNTFGAKTGDRALQLISRLLQQLLHEHILANAKCVCLARSGSDEFIFSVPSYYPVDGNGQDTAALPDANAICELLAARFGQPVMLGSYSIKLRFSAGIVRFPDIANGVEELMEGVSKARRLASRYQGNHWLQLDNEMVQHIREDRWLESELRQAIVGQQCFVVYQPQYDIHSGHIVGAEALLRWRHPSYGMVPPDRFIPIAEVSGQIMDIDLWVLDQACQCLGKLTAKGITDFRLAVNASGTELSNPAYPDAVRSTLLRYDIPPHRFGIEITETAIVELDEVAQMTVRALKEIGVEIELDDFGTGYTSLSHLTNLQLDVLKIDRSYIMQLESNPKLVDSILQLADAFSLRVIAEGVETIEQLKLLQQKRCHMAQGFLLSKPITEEELIALLFDDSLAD
ncbi:MAG: EAL domain-containing protein [Tolumonas sp.]|uniref:putative bifunctional diguanylate cyclase/phosphodiesterase n=1 Tax=Tolumonas auensis TaxID=43948 RepID=UPI001B52DE49|nr:EAL domain-containing protein [Tolumonas auensis]MBP7980519.1 EAL domain-containing protein [Tolumonas sp.]